MSRASVARRLAKEAAPHFSVLKVFLDNLRKGRDWDSAGEEAFNLTKPSLMRNVRGRKAPVDDVVETADFDPGDLSYHGSYGLIDDFRIPKGDLGVHVTGDPMTAIERGYDQLKGRHDLNDVVGASEDLWNMQDLLRSFYDLGESAPAGKNIAKWFKGRPRPFSHEAMGNYDFNRRWRPNGTRYRTIDPFRLGVDYNVYPLLQKKGLKSLLMGDVGQWNDPQTVLMNMKAIGEWNPAGGGLRRDILRGGMPEFYKRNKRSIDRMMSNDSTGFSHEDEKVVSWLKDLFEKEGIGAIDYPNTTEGVGELSRLILDPAKNLRSPFADFKGGSGWMAGLLPLISMLHGKREE